MKPTVVVTCRLGLQAGLSFVRRVSGSTRGLGSSIRLGLWPQPRRHHGLGAVSPLAAALPSSDNSACPASCLHHASAAGGGCAAGPGGRHQPQQQQRPGCGSCATAGCWHCGLPCLLCLLRLLGLSQCLLPYRHPTTLPPADHAAAGKTSTAASPPAQTVWNGEGPDYDMLDVERLHDEMARRPTEPDASQYDGEGPGAAGRGGAVACAANASGSATSMPCPVLPCPALPCPADFGMSDVERFHEEAAKDRAVRRK